MNLPEDTIEKEGLFITLVERYTVGGDPLTVYDLLVNGKVLAVIETHPDSSEPRIMIPIKI